MEPERAVDELYAMAQLLASNVASKALRASQGLYTVAELTAETEKWVAAAQNAHRLSEERITAPARDITTDVCNHDVSDPGQSPCRCLRPRGHMGIHECSHNLGRFTRVVSSDRLGNYFDGDTDA